MSCHELAALRLGLMNVLGINDEAERQHELAEIGDAATNPGPIGAMLQASDLNTLRRRYEHALSVLEERVSKMPSKEEKLPYYRSLLILTKKVEMDLRNQTDALTKLYQDLEEMHDFVHEVYPAN